MTPREQLLAARDAIDAQIKALDVEPDPLLVEARKLWAEANANKAYQYEGGMRDDYPEMLVTLAALRRGMELGRGPVAVWPGEDELLEALHEARTTISNTRTNILMEIGRCASPSESRWEGVPELLKKQLVEIDALLARCLRAHMTGKPEGGEA